MASGFVVSYNQAQFKRLSAKLSPPEVAQLVHQTTRNVADFMRGKAQEYPPEKRVTRRQAYGVTFFTAKQRRWFWAALNSGELELPYRRTNTLRDSWNISGGNDRVMVTNTADYFKFVHERGRQSRMMTIIGWKTVSYWLQKYKSEIGRVGIRNARLWAEKR